MIEIYHIASTIATCNIGNCEKCRIRCTYSEYAEKLYNAGYRKTFTSELASDTQKAFKEDYQKAQAEAQAYADMLHKADEEIAELRTQLVNKEKDYDSLIKSQNKMFSRFAKERENNRKTVAKEIFKEVEFISLSNSNSALMEELKKFINERYGVEVKND